METVQTVKVMITGRCSTRLKIFVVKKELDHFNV